jgi:hypothetical protein
LTSKSITYGSLMLNAVGLNLLTWYAYQTDVQRHNNLQPHNGSLVIPSPTPPHDISLYFSFLVALNLGLFLYSVGVGYLVSSSSKNRGGGKGECECEGFPPPRGQQPPVVERNCETKYMYITPPKRSYEIKIGGRCDGLVRARGEIIECKARQTRLFHKVYDTEKVQAMIYLAIMNDIETKRFQSGGKKPVELSFTVCKLIEEFKEEIDVHEISFDLEFYEKIRTRLIDVTDLLYRASILQDPRAQFQIFQMRLKVDDDDVGVVVGEDDDKE